MHTNISASALTKTLKAFQAVMLVMAIITMSSPVTSFKAFAQEVPPADVTPPAEETVTPPSCEAGFHLDDGECVADEEQGSEENGPDGGPQTFSVVHHDNENDNEDCDEGFHRNDGDCVPDTHPAPENSCVAPSTLDQSGQRDIGHSPDGTNSQTQEIMNAAGYSVTVGTDQTNDQAWTGTGNTVHFSAKYLAGQTANSPTPKTAGNKHVFGYMLNGGAFVAVFKDYADNGDSYDGLQVGGTEAFDLSGVSDVVFAMKDVTSGKTYATKSSLNDGSTQHAVVYNPSSDTYAIGFEDQNLGDHDYNDLMVEVKVTGCEKSNTATVVATKIVCDNESDLPNAMGSSHVTDANTAADFLAEHKSCHLQKDWQFEWGNQSAADGGRDLVGHASGYTTSGLTAADGTVSMTVPLDDLSEIHVRELLQDGYIPFTYDTAHPSDADTVSAELSCSNDGLHYDNYDFIRNPAKGHTYYCVAWNVEKEHAPVCDPEINLVSNGSFEAPVVTNGAGWDAFPTGIPGLVWAADFLGAALGGNVEIHGGVNGWLASAGNQYTELDSDINGPSSPGGASAVEISQNLVTVSGQQYKVSFDLSARPGTDATQNSVGVYQDGNAVGIANALATAGNQTEWNTHDFYFTADDAATLFALRDAGTPNDSLGTFIDNVKVTCVPDETIDVCSNLEGNQEETPAGYTNNDGICTPVEQCNDDAVTTLLSGDMGEGELITAALGHGAAKLVASPNGAWFAPGVGDGLWIWKDTSTSDTDAQNPTSQTFERNFKIEGTPLDATLTLAADNTYAVVVNGNAVCSDLGEFNYGATVNCTIPAADMTTGWNTLDITVTNKPIEGSTGAANPAGLSYKLVSHDNQCVETPTCDLETHHFNNDEVCVPNETVTEETPTHRNRHNGSGGGSTGEVLGASTCGPLLTDYLKLGWANNADEVIKLQQFLNDHVGVALPLSGFFGPSTFEAVKAFQLQYGNDVLTPWVGLPASGITGDNTPTGFVYQTTRWKINNIWCPGSEQFPAVLN